MAIANAVRNCRNWTTLFRTNRPHGQQNSRCRTLHDAAVSHWPRSSSRTTLTSCGRPFLNLDGTRMTSYFPLMTNCGNSQTYSKNTRNHSRLGKTLSGNLCKQESRADAEVSARQSRHLAINCGFGFLNSDSNSLTCVATWRKRSNTDNIS